MAVENRATSGGVQKSKYTTKFASLENFDKGGVELINDDPRHYAFSNVYEVASKSKPWEKVAVGKNMEYVLEVVRAEGESEWRMAAHDEFVVCLDGATTVELIKPSSESVPESQQGSIALKQAPEGALMGRIHLSLGHQALLPAQCAYRFINSNPGVLLMQTIEGVDTQYRWAQICQTV